MIKIHKCLRCGHDWPSRMDRLPKVCPKCKSPYWNKPRRIPVAKQDTDDDKAFIYFNRDIYYYQKGEELKEAALVFEAYRSSKVELIERKYLGAYYLLIGFALENYYKAAIISKRLNNTTETKIDDEFDHDLPNLVKKAGIQINNKRDALYLNKIAEYIGWKGRYAVPRKSSKLKGYLGHGSIKTPKMRLEYYTNVEFGIPIEAIHGLLKQALDNIKTKGV